MKARFILSTLALLGIFLFANPSVFQGAPPVTYRIAGIVVDSVTGQPLDGAEVTIAPVAALDDAQTFLSSTGGRFSFTNLALGKYRLMASRRGYATQALLEHEGYSTAIAVGPGLDSEHIRFPLAPSSVITGAVTDDWGDSVRDAKVLLFQQSMFDGSRTLRNINQTMTDDLGRYRFVHLLPGTYAVAVYARPWYTQSPMQYVSSISGKPEENTLYSLAVVEGPVQFPPANQDPLFDVVYPVTFFPGVTTLAEAGRLALAPGATETADFQLRAVPSVHLRVRVPVQPVPVTITTQRQEDGQQTTNQEESSADPAQVSSAPDVALALKIGDGYTEQIETDRKETAPGIVELSGIPPGQVEVNLMAGAIFGGQEDSIVAHGEVFNLSGNTEVDLSAPGDSARVAGSVVLKRSSATAAALSAAPAGKVPPRPAASNVPDQASPDQRYFDAIVQNAQEGLPNVTLSLHSLKTGESYSATVSAQGKFSFAASALPASSYEVEFRPESGLRVSSLEATGATISGRTIEILAGQPVYITVHAAEANCALSGFALKKGKPVSGAMVLLVPQDPGHDMSLYHRDQSDSDGSFTMSAIFPGRYILLAIENGWDLEWADPKVMLQYLPGGQPLELQPGASLTLNAKVQ